MPFSKDQRCVSMTTIPTKTLPSGHKIPSLGLGVYESEPGDETYYAVLTALKIGYRHIDTAQHYKNEEDVGRAVRDSGIPREEVFVTSKVLLERWTYNGVVETARQSNELLGLGYIDLYLLHAPLESATRADAWRALEDLQAEGILRDIGVSNFGEAHLKKLSQTWRVKPAVNQIELHPWLARKETVTYCQAEGIFLESYSPLARATRLWDPTLLPIAKEVNASPAQVLIAWSLAQGYIALPKSVKTTRIRENLNGAALQLTEAQLKTLSTLDRYKVTNWDPIKDHAV